MTDSQLLRQLPSIDRLLQAEPVAAWIPQYGRESVVATLRAVLEDARQRVRDGETVLVSADAILETVLKQLEADFLPTLRPVINATGVIIHTNLGRAPLSLAAQAAMVAIGQSYSTLEYDLENGKRGSRLIHAEKLLCDITGAEGALVVNNNASALVLLLSALARGKAVILSRGQLVEIGGGFRIPDIMQQSGATLVEVGTTNRTRAADYVRAITEQTALLMRVHSSNFKQIGFVEETPLEELAQIAHARGLHLVDDLGSGALLDTAQFGLAHEPMAQESIAGGADLVAFSGDKLLGGPQAGILIGKRDIIDQLKRHPLARAVRADKLCYAALTATLEHYRKGDAITQIPIWQMIARPLDELRQTAERWAAQLGGYVVAGESTVGGGSLPGATLPTMLVALEVESADAFAAKLRAAETPIIARIADNRILFDLRTIHIDQECKFLSLVTGLNVS